MPELETITIRGFKSIAAIEKLKLEKINVVIGANGSGKSNFLGAFSFLQAIREGRLQDYVAKAGGADRVLHFGSKTTQTLFIHLSFKAPNRPFEIALRPTDGDRLYDAVSSVLDSSQRKEPDNWRVYHFQDTGASSPMKKTCKVDDNRYLRPDGGNLAAFLNLLRQRYMAEYDLIRRTVQLVAPFFDDFQLEPLRLNPDSIRLEWRHRDSDAYFDAASLSDGTLRFIALATLLLQPEIYRPSVILIDEPELGLHPYAIAMLASLIQQASVATQVIVSTQSPLLLDNFAPEDVLVADLVDGGTQLTRLQSAKLETWLEEYSLGQLWEKNELGGRPGGA